MNFADCFRSQGRHARLHIPGIPYHIMSKAIRGNFLMVPKAHTLEITAGVVGKAQENWPNVELHGYAFLSNHFHLMVSGDSREVSLFVAFIKREISRRLGQIYNFKGAFWQSRFTSTGLPTPESQVACLRYILSQGVKEHLVAHPLHWPGLHCAQALLTGESVTGSWFKGTEYGMAKRNQQRSSNSQAVRKKDFYHTVSIKLTPIPPWRHLGREKQLQLAQEMVQSIVDEAAEERKEQGIRVVGRKAVMGMSIFTRVAPPLPPWWEDRRRQITAWAKLSDPLTEKFLRLYWGFQKAFRAASECFKSGEEANFPKGAWLPAHYA